MKKLIFTTFLFYLTGFLLAQPIVSYYTVLDDNGEFTWQKTAIEYFYEDPTQYPITTINDTASIIYYMDTFNLSKIDILLLKGGVGQYVRGDGSIVSFPTIPTNTNQLTNGAGFLVSSNIAGKMNISDTTSMLAPYMRVNNAYSKTQSDGRYYLLNDTFPSGKVMTTSAAMGAINGINNDVNGKATKATTLTINGTAFDLSANRTWSNVGIELPSQTGQSGKYLTTNGTSASWTTASNAPGNDKGAVYSSGSAYNITTSSAKIDFTGGGSVDPSITIPAPGTYVIMSNVRIDYTGLTNAAANTVSIKLRRTNNTPADISDATGSFIVPPLTLLTSTGGDCDVNTIFYTTTNSNDVLELWASRSASISAGNIQAGNAWIVFHRIY